MQMTIRRQKKASRDCFPMAAFFLFLFLFSSSHPSHCIKEKDIFSSAEIKLLCCLKLWQVNYAVSCWLNYSAEKNCYCQDSARMRNTQIHCVAYLWDIWISLLVCKWSMTKLSLFQANCTHVPPLWCLKDTQTRFQLPAITSLRWRPKSVSLLSRVFRLHCSLPYTELSPAQRTAPVLCFLSEFYE